MFLKNGDSAITKIMNLTDEGVTTEIKIVKCASCGNTAEECTCKSCGKEDCDCECSGQN
jgi:recombinational DNA repair protein RecR